MIMELQKAALFRNSVLCPEQDCFDTPAGLVAEPGEFCVRPVRRQLAHVDLDACGKGHRHSRGARCAAAAWSAAATLSANSASYGYPMLMRVVLRLQQARDF